MQSHAILHVSWKLLRACNYKCQYCHDSACSNKRDEDYITMFLEKFLSILNNIDYSYAPPLVSPRMAWLNDNLDAAHSEDFINFYFQLADEQSKALYLKYLENSIGASFSANRHKYGFFPPAEWDKMLEAAKKISDIADSYQLDIVETFILEGYSYNDQISVKSKDIVIDAGAYTGNTALYFARRVGHHGKVYAFEAMPQTYEKLENNLKRLAISNVECLNLALAGRSGQLIFSNLASPSSKRIENLSGTVVQAVSIDEFVENNKIPRIDFIKMDIEGSELDALNGSIKTIKNFHPVLAVCIYHKTLDWVEIPKRIRQIDNNYKFYLKHNSIDFSETVLFAKYDEAPEILPDIGDEAKQVSQIWGG